MAKVKTIKVGTVIPVDVTQEWINESIPCDKGSCMLTLSAIATLDSRFGADNYNVKSTNHGIVFDFGDYRILCVFDHKTSERIYLYDEVYKKTRNVAKARASAKPFRAKLMVESCQKKVVYPPMSEETKAKLAASAKARATGHGTPDKRTGVKTSNRRQLSL